MTILLLGGTGKTSSRIALRLHDANIPLLLASRSGTAPDPSQACHFDWLDEATYGIPFERATDIVAVYLVAPPMMMDLARPMKAFIDFARRRGVRRFVLLSASPFERGGPLMGSVHDYLASLDVDYAVLRPTWFMENFSEMQHRATVRDENRIYSATGEGKIAWISVEDVAAVGYETLTHTSDYNRDLVIQGPELLSYDDVARIMSRVLGREISHVKLTQAELSARFQSRGMPQDYATMLSALDNAVAHGSENRMDDVVHSVTGRCPTTFGDFVERHKSCWV